jgi:hypothetical protein
MPVNYEQIQKHILAMGEKAPTHFKSISQKIQQTRDEFARVSWKSEEMQQRIEQYRSSHPGYRCALPSIENLLGSFPAPNTSLDFVLLSADGSQVTPSHHDAVEFGVVNIGIFRFCPSEPAREFTATDLLYFENVETDDGLVNEDFISLKRDLQERQMLLDLAGKETKKVITLTDGPLEIFGEPKKMVEYQTLFDDYLATLRNLAKLETVTAGYVDKPRADLVVRMLELSLLSSCDFSAPAFMRKLAGVTDTNIFDVLLLPGERSAILGIQSLSSAKFSNELALHFFYLNLGRKDHPSLARVEIPAWVAQKKELVDLLHLVLWEQSQMLGTHPYPYALHRAHEIALVKFEEKEHISSLIQAELLRKGINPVQKSNKQSAKDLPGKKRYGK